MASKTALRLTGLSGAVSQKPPLVVCNAEHRFIAAQQLSEAGVVGARILLEPERRNTAPALTLAALESLREVADGTEPVLLAIFNLVGGLLVLTIMLVILEVQKVPLANYLPALVLGPLLAWWWLV